MKKFSEFRLKCQKFPKAKGPTAPSQKGWKNPGGGPDPLSPPLDPNLWNIESKMVIIAI